MSTFKGYVAEFPHIRIDYFRKSPDIPPPLACFLSHVHSDHLQGLESLKAPFIYCSPTTRELLLRIEKYPHRMNFAKGILETREQHYRHLKNLLKTIPLETPTEIELGPQAQLRVTLFDVSPEPIIVTRKYTLTYQANHCAGAVMFLIEGDGKAVLYTGDIRSEAWWVNSIVRNPLLIPYTFGDRRLDKVYLDTTFAVKGDPYRVFPSKAEGLKELLAQVAKYPASTTFHMNSWTFGYEDVWIALSAALGSQVHVDKYKMGLYKSLATISGDGVGSYEGPALCGYKCGNRLQPGCLTNDQQARLHSCERGTECTGIGSEDVVWITPIITRTNTGEDIPELGAGGGGGDLDQIHELELNDTAAVGRLITLCSTKIQDPHLLAKVINIVSVAMTSEAKTLSFDNRLTTQDAEGNISLLGLTEILSMVAKDPKTFQKLSSPLSTQASTVPKTAVSTPKRLSRHIQFPYSRHSSYDELCHLVEAFKPIDVYPCTTDVEGWYEGLSIQSLFGHLCSGSVFMHDREMRKLEAERVATRNLKRNRDELSQGYCTQESSQITDSSDSDAEITLVEGVSQSAPPEKSRKGTKRPRPRETFWDCTEEPNRTGPSLRSPIPPFTATQKAFGVSSDTEVMTESRLQRTLETANLHRYRCAWLGCQEDFRTIGVLRRHVSNQHLTTVVRNRPVAYGCLWGSCAGPNISYFGSEEMWESHMDEIHYHAEMQRVLDQGEVDEQRGLNAGSQRSLPSPPIEDRDVYGTNRALEPPDPTENVQATPIRPSDETNEPRNQGDENLSHDISLADIPDPELRKQLYRTAHELNSSYIMARTLLQAKGDQPHRRLFTSQTESAMRRSRPNPIASDRLFVHYAGQISRLRKILPTADEPLCFWYLWKYRGNFIRARDEVAECEERRLADVRDSNDERTERIAGDQLSRYEGINIDNDINLPHDNIDNIDSANNNGNTDNTNASNETTSFLSLPTPTFHSPTPSPTSLSPTSSLTPSLRTRARTRVSPSRFRHRKEAYEAARGLSGREWAVYSLVSAGNNHSEKEVEL